MNKPGSRHFPVTTKVYCFLIKTSLSILFPIEHTASSPYYKKKYVLTLRCEKCCAAMPVHVFNATAGPTYEYTYKSLPAPGHHHSGCGIDMPAHGDKTGKPAH
jgi:hypothetical protein